MLHRLKGRPAAYIASAVLGVAGIGGLSSAVAQQQGQPSQGQPTAQGQQTGQGQPTTQGQTAQGQGQGTQGEGQGQGQGQGEGQLFPSDCSQGQGQNCGDCAQGEGSGCNPDTAAQEEGNAPVERRVVVVRQAEAPEVVTTQQVHFGG